MATKWNLDPTHSKITLAEKVRHMMISDKKVHSIVFQQK